MAWAQVKGHIKGNAKHFNLTETEQLAWDGFAVVTPDRWKKLIRHVREKVEDHYWSCDGLYQQCTQRFIIRFGEGDSDSDGGTSGEELVQRRMMVALKKRSPVVATALIDFFFPQRLF